MPNYPHLNKKIDPAKKHYAAVKKAVDDAKNVAQVAFFVSAMGGVTTLAMAITAAVNLQATLTVGQAIELFRNANAVFRQLVQTMQQHYESAYLVIVRLRE